MSRRQKRALHVVVSRTQPIDVDSHRVETAKESTPQPWIPQLGLDSSDKDILNSRSEWLNDKIVNASQKLLKKAKPACDRVTRCLPWSINEFNLMSLYR